MLALAGLPALATAVGAPNDHASHSMQADAASADNDDARDERLGHDHAAGCEHHAQADGGEAATADELQTHADCAGTDCLVTCSACSHCQGALAPGSTGVSAAAIESHILKTSHNGPPVAALHRPPILS